MENAARRLRHLVKFINAADPAVTKDQSSAEESDQYIGSCVMNGPASQGQAALNPDHG